MGVSLLDPPSTRPEAPSPRPTAAPNPRPRRRPENVLPVALLASAVVHLLLFTLLRFEPPVAAGPAFVRPIVQEPVGTRVIELVIVPDEALPQAVPPEREPEDATPRIVRAPVGGTPTEALPAERRDPATVVERISPRLGDARLFAPPDAAMPAPADYEALALQRLYGQMTAYNDSVDTGAEAARRALDWTTTDADGNKWGVSPGKIHLGGLTLPLPIGFATPPGRREELAERNRRWGEIEGQRSREEGRATFEDRVKAIRERVDAQRDSTRRSGTGGK